MFFLNGRCAAWLQVRVAKASAALEGRDDVSPEDVQKAVKLVILPRSDLSQMNQPDVRAYSAGTPLVPLFRRCVLNQICGMLGCEWASRSREMAAKEVFPSRRLRESSFCQDLQPESPGIAAVLSVSRLASP